jgi:hypothetical protein
MFVRNLGKKFRFSNSLHFCTCDNIQLLDLGEVTVSEASKYDNLFITEIAYLHLIVHFDESLVKHFISCPQDLHRKKAFSLSCFL